MNNYFDDQISEWDQINRVVLSLSYRSHRNKFNQSLSDQLQYINLENMILDIIDHPTNEQIERIDKMITSVLTNAVKSVRGMKRNIPFSK